MTTDNAKLSPELIGHIQNCFLCPEIERVLVTEFKAWLSAQKYVGASEDVMFKDWMWIKLKDQAAHISALERERDEEKVEMEHLVDRFAGDIRAAIADYNDEKAKREAAEASLAEWQNQVDVMNAANLQYRDEVDSLKASLAQAHSAYRQISQQMTGRNDAKG